ncbi:PaaI family thioesterase [Sulfitobacter sp. S190]|uniref:PaaI family thioesterase n=1 Tax=Sulfitobacter sp. S190 TaxID=2867022 RepID=UPI0021A2D138|nr:PaaI family thioesterase [Sulfitobacter sp. S190]UWR21946.1 PaaI family thioesterase [Sulfitobacter sp. S190]
MPLAPPETLIRDETGTQRLVGYVVDVSDPAHGRCWLDVDERHLNRHGALHGGIAVTLLDNASGTTGSLTVDATGKAPFLTVSLNTQFVGSGKPGRITATGTVTGGGRSLLFISADLRHEDGTLVATSTGVFKRVPKERLT